MELGDLVGVMEAAQELGVSRQRVLQLQALGVLPGVLIGRTWVFRRQDVLACKDRPGRGRPRKDAPGDAQETA